MIYVKRTNKELIFALGQSLVISCNKFLLPSILCNTIINSLLSTNVLEQKKKVEVIISWGFNRRSKPAYI